MRNLLHRKIKTINKFTTVNTSNLQPGELIHMEFSFYNITFVCDFTSILTVVCANTIMMWLFPTAFKRAPVCIMSFILTILNNEQHPFKRVIVDEYSALEKSTYVTNLLIE